MKNAQKALYNASFTYLILGLIAGLFYREFTKAQDFPTDSFTQLSVMHTHLLILGFTVSLIVLALEKLYTLSRSKLFTWGFWLYNLGIVVTVSMMGWRGSLQVLNADGGEVSKALDSAISGMSGIGHVLLSVSLVLVMVTLGGALKRTQVAEERAHTNV